jgi:opacity protein-like surface antigen
MRKVTCGWLCGVAVFFLAASAGAQSDRFTKPGPYLGVGPSYLYQQFQGRGGDADFGDTWGFNARGGYRFSPYCAAEAEYEYGDTFGTHPNFIINGQQFTNRHTIQTNTFTLSGKGILPLYVGQLNGAIQPYLTGGIGFLNANANRNARTDLGGRSGTSFAGRVGGGLDFPVTEHIVPYFDYSYVMTTGGATWSNNAWYTAIGFGVKYQFSER